MSTSSESNSDVIVVEPESYNFFEDVSCKECTIPAEVILEANDSNQPTEDDAVNIFSQESEFETLKRGRQLSNIWAFFTCDDKPHQKKLSICNLQAL